MKNNAKIKIAVIDGYVNTSMLKKQILKKSFLNRDVEKSNIHGTIVVAKIIDEFPEAQITAIEILENNNRCEIDKLIKGLEYALYQEFDIINISLGCESISNQARNRLQNLCNQIRQKGTVIFAAKSNNGKLSYPADFKGIVKVGSDPYRKEIYNIEIESQSIIFSRNCISLISNGIVGIHKGNSFLCPWVVGIFAVYLKNSSCYSHDVIEKFFCYLNKVRVTYEERIFTDSGLRPQNIYLFQGKHFYLTQNAIKNLNPIKIIMVNKISNIFIANIMLKNQVNKKNKTLVIDGFLCCDEREKNIMRKFILFSCRHYKQIIMYGNYFNLVERMEINDKMGISLKTVFL